MKLKTDPSYTTLKYYYSDKTCSDTFLFKKDYKNQLLLGSLILTEDGRVYFSATCGKNILPDSLLDAGIYPASWMNLQEIEYCIKYQPYDFDEWYAGWAMYSKNFLELLVSDIREAKLKYIQNQIDENLVWIHSDQ